MKITRIRTDHFRIPLPVVLSDSTHGDISHFGLITARIETAVGLEGMGYTYCGGLPGVSRRTCAEAEPGMERAISCGRAGSRRVGGREAGERRFGKSGTAEKAGAAEKTRARRDGSVVGSSATGARVGDSAPDSVRKQGAGNRPWRQIRGRRLVCPARHRS